MSLCVCFSSRLLTKRGRTILHGVATSLLGRKAVAVTMHDCEKQFDDCWYTEDVCGQMSALSLCSSGWYLIFLHFQESISNFFIVIAGTIEHTGGFSIIIVKPRNLLNYKNKYRSLEEACLHKPIGFKKEHDGFVVDKHMKADIQADLHISNADSATVVFINQNNLEDFITIECPKEDFLLETKDISRLENFFNTTSLDVVVIKEININLI